MLRVVRHEISTPSRERRAPATLEDGSKWESRVHDDDNHQVQRNSSYFGRFTPFSGLTTGIQKVYEGVENKPFPSPPLYLLLLNDHTLLHIARRLIRSYTLNVKHFDRTTLPFPCHWHRIVLGPCIIRRDVIKLFTNNTRRIHGPSQHPGALTALFVLVPVCFIVTIHETSFKFIPLQ